MRDSVAAVDKATRAGRSGWSRRGILASAPLLLARPASAQSDAITMVVPYAAGGGTDIVGREFAQVFARELGRTVVIDNRGGAAGYVGVAAVARARPDGATLLFAVNTNVTLNAHLQRSDQMDLVASLAPVAQLSTYQYVLVADPRLNTPTLRDFLTMAKSRPSGDLTFSSTGIGTNSHLAGLLVGQAAGIELEHIAYRGAAPAILDVVAGRIAINFSSPPATIPLVRSGQLRALAVTGTSRLSSLPEVPTLAEAGLPGVTITGWHGIFAPVSVPADLLDTFHDAALRAAASPTFRERLDRDGLEPVEARARNSFAALVRDESAFWGRKVQELNLRLE
jgi:tripartite-type tricarboxylate transporter receptor subunit TctC